MDVEDHDATRLGRGAGGVLAMDGLPTRLKWPVDRYGPETPLQRTAMIEALKSDTIVEKAGGRFKLCALIQRRLVQLMEGGRPLVERNGRTDLEVVIDEIMQDKITVEFAPDEPQIEGSTAGAEDEQPLLS